MAKVREGQHGRTYVEYDREERIGMAKFALATKPVAALMLATPLAPLAPFVFVLGISIGLAAIAGGGTGGRSG